MRTGEANTAQRQVLAAAAVRATEMGALLTLPAAHRVAFRQERPYRRAVALVLGELFAFARHTVTQTLLALGLGDADWTAFYRLFSRPRFEEATLNACLFRETLVRSRPSEPYGNVETLERWNVATWPMGPLTPWGCGGGCRRV